MNIDKKRLTPMMRQYIEVKEKYADCILFFRLGDFYEMFFEDALVASRVLEIALTGKSCGLDERAPMCGVPFHSADSYVAKLVENGYKVAIGEQLEDPSVAKGIVRRDVIRVITPGTILEEGLLDNKKNNYLLSIYKQGDDVGITYVDISTGEVNATCLNERDVVEEVAKISPSEIVLNEIDFINKIKNIAVINNIYINEDFKDEYLDTEILRRYFKKDYLISIGLDKNEQIKNSLSIILNYICATQMQVTNNINSINIYNAKDYMVLDLFTRSNLELTQTIRGKKKKGSLLNVLDKTCTAMGGRLLRKYVEEPLINKEKIEERLDVIEEIKDDFAFRDDLVNILKNIYDIERICGKIAFEKVTPKELINLKNSIEKIPKLIGIVENSNKLKLKKYTHHMDSLKDLHELIEKSILEEPSIGIKDGNIIKSGYDLVLDELREISKNGSSMIKQVELSERNKTGVKSLKIGFNKVFGYYVEITKANLSQAKIDDTYIRKQTISNAERFITPQLKEIEEKILSADEKIKALEYEIFTKIRKDIYNNIDRIQKVAKLVSNIDVFTSMAIVSAQNNYVKPVINEGQTLNIKSGRHPVIENIIGFGNFVPNDTYLNDGENIINIITGPNMSGKSTYMRQTALISLMAHMGSFVPAEFAEIPIMDRIFTRVGASDDLAQGQSTFMVEMSEVSHILHNATASSLIILDEIGRGTSTYDGISLAWSIVEYIQSEVKCKTLFATHYHELTDLEEKFEDVKNYSISVKEDGNSIIFLRKIIPQSADKSYGIYVAELAKLPSRIIERSKTILDNLEKNHLSNKSVLEEISITKIKDVKERKNKKIGSISMFETEMQRINEVNLKLQYDSLKKDYEHLLEESKKLKKINLNIDRVKHNEVNDNIKRELESLDILNMTPLEAIGKLYDLQKKVKNFSKISSKQVKS